MITLKEWRNTRYVSVSELHRALGVREPSPGTWIAKRISEMCAHRGADYRWPPDLGGAGLRISAANFHLSPRFAQEVALWERSPTSQVVARAINRQLRTRTELLGDVPSKSKVAPTAKIQAVIDGLNDPATLRAVLFHFIQQKDKQESPD